MHITTLTSSLILFIVLQSLGCSASPAKNVELDEDYYDPVFDDEKGDEEGTEEETSSEVPSPPSEEPSPPENKCGCKCGLASQKSRIVGGRLTLPNEFPWLAAFLKDTQLYCAGSLITQRHILTAAHCLRGFRLRDIAIVLGGHDRKEFLLGRGNGIEDRKILRAALHPKFDPITYDNDVAVVTLNRPVAFTDKIQTVCLPSNDGRTLTGEAGTAVGWGRTSEINPTSALPMKVEVVIMSKEECDRSGYGPKRITDNMICAGYMEGGRDSCQGDSGGPLLYLNKEASAKILGVVSWGRGCARRKFPGVYTKLTNYLDFINEQIKSECLCSPS